ncbi:hypothetical protein QVD17_22528 [Tagetes erecta]|uniref:TIR domain-containing protein n=1 Tax=Tagetes erecta TaxID=13708 RepID=A0AAD8KD27_TARER|nr:hypothetical protein QVD17_22528 [Tagetes erecta]
MASTSLSSHTRYDVFLSFRGEDTRNSFTDHLYNALLRAGLRTFRDDDEIDRGQEIKPELKNAIRESRASIVVLSKNYADSGWCLDELVLILEQRQNINQFVLPVFYHVDPSDVRNQRHSFSIQGSKWREVKVKQWKVALTEVSNLAGITVSGSETDVISKIVDTVYRKLDLKLLSTPANLTGIQTRAQAIISWLKDEQSNTNIVAVCGMGGSGKTTLAQYIYNSNKQNFESSSFLQDITMHKKQHDGLRGLQKQLLRDVLGGRNDSISNVLEGTCKIEGALEIKRALIVLDDIADPDELIALLGTKKFHAQSKIIITTRHLDMQGWFGPISRTCHMYKLELLNDNESLELLSCHAFGSKIPMEGFEVLALQLAQYCEGNPLALKVLGSSLFVSDRDPHIRHGMIEIWKSTLSSMNSLKGDLDRKIEGILRRSFDSLPLDSHRELFLHIACFFIDEYIDFVINILEDEWHVTAGIRTLFNKCLLTLSPINKLMMHQLLQEMGRKIVREESKDPAKRSIVWNDDDSYRVLRKGKGSDTIEDLALDMRNLKKGTKNVAFSTSSIANMDQLKFLKLRYVELTGPYDDFPELIWLSWQGSPLKTIPDGLLMSSLVAIDMSNGALEKFEPPTLLDCAKIVNLYGCRNLVSVVNLDLIPNLESLILWNCTSLTYICETIGELEKLGLLDLNRCNKLWKNKQLETCLFSIPKSLQVLYLDYCDLNDMPVVLHPQSFFEMSLAGNLFEYLPNNIDLTMLRVLTLSSCPNLKSILCLPSTLQDLYTDWCTSLEKITFQSRRYTLQNFVYEGCFKLSEIQGLFKLVSVSELDESYLGHMKWIKAYQDLKVDLVGDTVTKGRIWHIQMLHEYGIRSIFLPSIKNLTFDDYTSSSAFLSFDVPLHQEKSRIQGLNITCLYRTKGENQVIRGLLVRIVNYTKDLAWLYNPVVHCKPTVDDDVMWLSYWPIGNTLDVGDKVYVTIIEYNELIVNGCGASLVYMDEDGYEIDQQENTENYTKEEEVIGGNLSEFEVAPRHYYLCRRDLFKPMYLGDALNKMLGVKYTGSQGWRKSRKLGNLHASMMEQKTLQGNVHKEIVLGVSFKSEDEAKEIKKMVSSLVGVEIVSTNIQTGRLMVAGLVDPETLANHVREFDKMVEILSVDYIY